MKRAKDDDVHDIAVEVRIWRANPGETSKQRVGVAGSRWSKYSVGVVRSKRYLGIRSRVSVVALTGVGNTD